MGGSLELGCEVDRLCERNGSTRTGAGSVGCTVDARWFSANACPSNREDQEAARRSLGSRSPTRPSITPSTRDQRLVRRLDILSLVCKVGPDKGPRPGDTGAAASSCRWLADRQAQVTQVGVNARDVGQQRWRHAARQPVAAEANAEQGFDLPEFRRDGPGQLAVEQVEITEVPELAQLGRDGAGQRVQRERQHPQVGQRAQFGRDRPRQLVAPERQDDKAGQLAQRRWDWPREVVAPEVQKLEARDLRQLDRNGPAQLVVVQPEFAQIGPLAWRQQDRPGELVVREVQRLQVGQWREFRRDRPRQLVRRQVELAQGRRLAQVRRDRSRQVILREIQRLQVG